jgi:hypothetical protein
VSVPGGGLRFRRRKAQYDKQPTESAAVLLASGGVNSPDGQAFSREAMTAAARLSCSQPVAIVAVARIYGSAWGLPNPGLMPTRKELDTLLRQVSRASAILGRSGSECFGQVAIARRAEKAIARAALAREVGHVVIDVPARPRWRRVVEGDPVRVIQRKVGPGVIVHPVPGR